MGLRFEFDPLHKILLARLEGPLTEKLLEEFYRLTLKYWIATGACAGILDGSSVTEVALSSDLIRALAIQEPSAEMAGCPRVFVVPRTDTFGLARMFQLAGENRRPLLSVVHTMGEAFATLGVQPPHFETVA
jgi:hypothetical protein